MEVRYFADIRPLAGTIEEARTSVPPTVNDLLAVLSAEKGPAFENRVFPGRQAERHHDHSGQWPEHPAPQWSSDAVESQ